MTGDSSNAVGGLVGFDNSGQIVNSTAGGDVHVGRNSFRYRQPGRPLYSIMSKRRNAPYRSGRTDTWRKVKCRNRQEFVIGGWKKSEHGGVGSLLIGVYNDAGELIYAGHVCTGFKHRTHVDLMKRFKPLEVGTTPLKDVPREHAKGARWLRPKLVAEVEFAEWTGDNILRHPSFKGLRRE